MSKFDPVIKKIDWAMSKLGVLIMVAIAILGVCFLAGLCLAGLAYVVEQHYTNSARGCDQCFELPSISPGKQQHYKMELLVDTNQRSSRQLLSELKRDWMMDSRGVLTVLECDRAARLNWLSDEVHRRCDLAIKDEPQLDGFTPKFRMSKYAEWREFDSKMFVNSSWALRGVKWVLDCEQHTIKLGRLYHYSAGRFIWGDGSGDLAAAMKWRWRVAKANPMPKPPWH